MRVKAPESFTPEAMEQLSTDINTLRTTYLFATECDAAEAIAEQHYLLALSFLEQAQRHATLAQYHQTRALVR